MPIHESIPSPDDLVQQARDWQADLFGDNLEGSWMCAFNGDPGLGADWTGRAAAKVLNSLPDYITLNRGYPPNLYYSPYKYSGGGSARRDDLFIEAAAVVVDDVGDQADVDEAERRYRAAQQEYKDGPLAAWKAAGSVRADKPKAPKWVGVKIAREKLLERIGPPTKSLETSAGNCQWTYILTEPCRDKAKLRSILMAIGSDAKDLARVMRSPGGANWKASALIDGRPFICRLLEEGCGTRYSIDDMLTAVGAEVHPEVERRRAAPGGEEKPEFQALREAGLLLGSAATANPDTHGSFWITCPGHLGDESEGGWPGAEVGHSAGQDQGRARVWPHGGFKCFHDSCRDRNFDDLCTWAARNSDTKPILERLRDEAAAQFARLPVPDLGILGGAGGGGGGGGALDGIAGGEDDDDEDLIGDDAPRIIRLDAGTLPRQVRDAVKALKKRARVYYYGRRSVEVILRAERNGIGGKVKAAQLVRLADNIVAQKLIEGVIDCYKYNAKAGDYIRADCTTRIAGNICNAKDLDLEEVIGTIRAPFLRRDGTIGGLQEGYDRKTGLWVDYAGVTYRPVLDAECTREGAEAALARCKVPLSKYRFAEKAGEAVALAGMLTPVARPAMIQVPMFGIDAPIQGSGKTKLALAICALMTGLAPALVQGIDDEKELDKRINAVLITGEQCVVLDNITGKKWGTSDLCAAVTAERVDIRPLGTSEIVKVMNTFIVFVTGNNLSIEGDVVRRILVCRIDPDVERPERASFDFDPVDYVRKHRVDLVHDLLVILRAYVLAGRPEQGGHTIGSFEDWSCVVRDALMWLGEADVAESIDLSRASSTSELEALLPLWAAAFGAGPATGRKAKDLRGYEHSVDPMQKAFGDCLRDNVFSLGADKIINEARWLGAWLGSKCDQRAAGFKLCRRKLDGYWHWFVSKGKEDDDNPID